MLDFSLKVGSVLYPKMYTRDQMIIISSRTRKESDARKGDLYNVNYELRANLKSKLHLLLLDLEVDSATSEGVGCGRV